MEVGRPAIDGIVAGRVSLYICSKTGSLTGFGTSWQEDASPPVLFLVLSA